MREHIPYQIVAVYDTETTNITSEGKHFAFPILHQVGEIRERDLTKITPDNVKDLVTISMYRHTSEALKHLADIAAKCCGDFVPVVCCHNLSFDHTNLAPLFQHFVDNGAEVRICAKSTTYPVTYTIKEPGPKGRPLLVFQDTKALFLKSLETMGKECGMPKLVGSWNYDKIRTPETELTQAELDYAAYDLYSLVAYLGHFLRLTPEIPQEAIGASVVTKTGIVRHKRALKFGKIGKGKNNVSHQWMQQNKTEMPATDDELHTMHASTRGGFTFTASKNASVVFEEANGCKIFAFDATSQHPAQMVSHLYPEKFQKAPADVLLNAFNTVASTNLTTILTNWAQPFRVAFYGAFHFTNLRLKAGSVYADQGISPLASARLSNLVNVTALAADNQQTRYNNYLKEVGYADSAESATHAFSKITSAESATLYLTELAAWEVAQAFDFDTVEALGGYATNKFCRPTDMSMLSVMEFYRSKDVFKVSKSAYDKREPIPNAEELKDIAPEYLLEAMMNGTASDSEVASFYQSLKADLNALFGIEATNEAKPDTFLSSDGIAFDIPQGIGDLPKRPKCWYQYGQRIVGWSRIAQHVVLQLCHPHSDAIVCGDTDSVKVYTDEVRLQIINNNLKVFADCLTKAKHHVTQRVRETYPDNYSEMPEIGAYIMEDTFEHFYCSWNKSYAHMHFDRKAGRERFSFTIAGITAGRGSVTEDGETIDDSLNDLADHLYHEAGWSFARIVETVLSYNVSIGASVTKMLQHYAPRFGDIFEGDITDCNGVTTHVREPFAVCLADQTKTIGSTGLGCARNNENYAIASVNNPNVNDHETTIDWYNGENPKVCDYETGEILYG